eukprot:14613133-Heterocapsa_arctica.AAC.1
MLGGRGKASGDNYPRGFYSASFAEPAKPGHPLLAVGDSGSPNIQFADHSFGSTQTEVDADINCRRSEVASVLAKALTDFQQ